MIRSLLFAMAIAVATLLEAQSPSVINAVQISATVQSSPASITLTWAPLAGSSGFTIYRKLKAATTWGSTYATATGSATQWTDNGVTLGTYYEYKVVRSASGGTGYGYIAAGVQVQPTEYLGKMILLVDNTLSGSLTAELQQLQTDMRADGWNVIRQDVSRTASVTSIRSIIAGIYNADPTNVKAVYLVGHVPVPYSGNTQPDGHSSHQGAWPADGYYGDVNGTWTDNSVNATGGYPLNWNVPGDGKFDQSDYPSTLELQVGRVDLSDMPSFAQSETQLLATYLTKAHNFKVKQWVPQSRGIVFDNLQWVSNPLASSGYCSIAALVGHQNITDCYPYGAAFTTYINNQSYLWTYTSGGGSQSVYNNVLTFDGANNIATTNDYATTTNMGGVFNMSFGSYFGDWDNRNNFLRAQIAGGQGLTSVWSAIPNWWFHHMGMGDPIGFSAIQSMNNGTIYTPQNSGWQGPTHGRVHLGLMGDPSLRMKMVAPPTSLQVTNSGGNASFSWTASPDAVQGYYLYQFDQTTGAVSRVVPTLITGTTFLSPTVPFVAGREYMVRAVKLETTPSGSYNNLSLGSIATAAGAAAPDCLGVVGGAAVPGSACSDGNACTTGDVYNASCQCVGTPSGDTDGDGICNAQDNCPTVAGQIGSTCNDNNACTTGDVLNSSCQCVGTAAVDGDGDGVCNAQDNCPTVAGQIGSTCNDGNPCTINDVLNSSCQCAGTVSPDTDGDGLCNAQDNCPNVAGQIGSSCNDGNACTLNDVLNSSCQCAGTASGDTDGDGICNAQDNCPTAAGQIGSACNDGNACTLNDVLNSSCQCVGTASGDTDGDGVCNAQDNCPTVPGQIGSTCNDGIACTINDVLNSSCQCVGTASGDTDGDGICNAQDNCPTVAGQIGSACNDVNACTLNDVLNSSCQCVGTASGDTDGDGICNAQDNCPTVAGQIGSACNDGNACTLNDVLNSSCQCVGTASGDTDGDGVCNAQDNCPSVVGQIGSSCNDGNPCTLNDMLNASCQCMGTASGDADGDGVCNVLDGCPNDPLKAVPGNCGCGAAEPGSGCNDGNASTINDVIGVNCQCAGSLVNCDDGDPCTIDSFNGLICVNQPAPDSDGDGLCDLIDLCPNGPNPGSSCNDGNVCTINDVVNAGCQCVGTPSGDTDGDGICNTQDNCPTVAGQIGSACNDGDACTLNDVLNSSCQCVGTASGDTDGDGICNAQDNCPSVPGQIGSSCNDGNANTLNDVLNGSCQCAGTAVTFDCAGVVSGTASVDACGVCSGGTTGIVPNSTCLDCLGAVNGPALPGTACNDNNANTINDTFDASCQCAGTAVTFDCAGVVSGTASVDACGVCSGGTTGIVPNSTCLDCLGAVNGPALPGTTCNDNNANTINDTFDASCQCAGTAVTFDCAGVVSGTASVDACGVCSGGTTGIVPNSTCLDCLGAVNGPALPGTTCNDNNANTINDTFDASCQCAGTAVTFDCAGVVSGTASVDACGVCSGGTTGIVPNSSCLDCLGAVNGPALPGTTCNDNNANTINDTFDASCQCAGTAVTFDCAGVVSGTASVDACGVCSGGTTGIVPNSTCLDCLGAVNGPALPGTTCNDNNANTINDTFDASCQCAGTAVTFDCAGVVSGTASVDACGVCSGGTTGIVPNSTCLDCLGAVNGPALPGTTCNDNNANTINDTFDASCQCAGTAVTFDCAGVVSGTASVDACGVCSGGTTGIVPNSSCLDCLGAVNGPALPGTTCNDNNANTINDTFDASCQCVGTAVTFDCAGVVSGTASVDACGVCSGGTTGIVPNSTCLDCLGAVNGPALPGTTCNDNNANTINDTFDASCQCVGTAVTFDCAGVVSGTASVDACGVCSGGTTGIVPNSTCLDCLGAVNGPALPGTTCNDNNANTINDTFDAGCQCAGTAVTFDCAGVVSGTASVDACGVCSGGTTGIVPNSTCVDCAGVVNGSALPGSFCSDNDPNTGNDVWASNCQCVGQLIDCLGVAGGIALPGTPCNDGNGGTMGDLWTSNCNCIGNSVSIDCTGTPGGTSLPGTTCDDGDATTTNDSWSVDCMCVGIQVDCAGVVGGAAFIDGCGTCAGGNTGVVPDADLDSDGLSYCNDICPETYNPDQADFDADGVGDVCDNCPWVSNVDQLDANGNGIGDLCETLTSIAEAVAGETLSIFPNPSREQLFVTSADDRVKHIRIVDVAGALVMEVPLSQRIDLQRVAQGTYIVIALDAEGRPLAQTRLIRQ